METKFLLRFGKLGKKAYYFCEILKYIRSVIIKRYRKLFGINEISQKKIKKFISKNSYKQKTLFLPLNQLITIVVPCYNHSLYLGKMFESIINQTQYPDEVILIDDFSRDNTHKKLEKFKSNYEKIFRISIYSNDKNLGQSKTLNYAISKAKTDLIMVLNDDDYLFYDAIEIVKKIFKLYKNIFMLGSTSIHFNNDSELEKYRKNFLKHNRVKDLKLTIHKPSDVNKYKNYNDLNMTHSGCTFHKYVWNFVGGYFSNKKDRVVPFSDRDFQLRVNCFFNVGVLYEVPLALWRSYSSLDYGKNT